MKRINLIIMIVFSVSYMLCSLVTPLEAINDCDLTYDYGNGKALDIHIFVEDTRRSAQSDPDAEHRQETITLLMDFLLIDSYLNDVEHRLTLYRYYDDVTEFRSTNGDPSIIKINWENAISGEPLAQPMEQLNSFFNARNFKFKESWSDITALGQDIDHIDKLFKEVANAVDNYEPQYQSIALVLNEMSPNGSENLAGDFTQRAFETITTQQRNGAGGAEFAHYYLVDMAPVNALSQVIFEEGESPENISEPEKQEDVKEQWVDAFNNYKEEIKGGVFTIGKHSRLMDMLFLFQEMTASRYYSPLTKNTPSSQFCNLTTELDYIVISQEIVGNFNPLFPTSSANDPLFFGKHSAVKVVGLSDSQLEHKSNSLLDVPILYAVRPRGFLDEVVCPPDYVAWDSEAELDLFVSDRLNATDQTTVTVSHGPKFMPGDTSTTANLRLARPSTQVYLGPFIRENRSEVNYSISVKHNATGAELDNICEFTVVPIPSLSIDLFEENESADAETGFSITITHAERLGDIEWIQSHFQVEALGEQLQADDYQMLEPVQGLRLGTTAILSYTIPTAELFYDEIEISANYTGPTRQHIQVELSDSLTLLYEDDPPPIVPQVYITATVPVTQNNVVFPTRHYTQAFTSAFSPTLGVSVGTSSSVANVTITTVPILTKIIDPKPQNVHLLWASVIAIVLTIFFALGSPVAEFFVHNAPGNPRVTSSKDDAIDKVSRLGAIITAVFAAFTIGCFLFGGERFGISYFNTILLLIFVFTSGVIGAFLAKNRAEQVQAYLGVGALYAAIFTWLWVVVFSNWLAGSPVFDWISVIPTRFTGGVVFGLMNVTFFIVSMVALRYYGAYDSSRQPAQPNNNAPQVVRGN